MIGRPRLFPTILLVGVVRGGFCRKSFGVLSLSPWLALDAYPSLFVGRSRVHGQFRAMISPGTAQTNAQRMRKIGWRNSDDLYSWKFQELRENAGN